MKTNPSHEILRKVVHFSGIFFLPLLFRDRRLFALLLSLFLILYLFTEWLDARGVSLPCLTWLVRRCKRPQEKNRLSQGALSLALAGITAPYFFGVRAAALGLVQIFVADTVATFAGMRWGKKKIPYSRKKSWVGSTAFFLTAVMTNLFFVPFPQAFCLALAGAFFESLPWPGKDNLIVPLGVGFLAGL